MEEGRLPPSQVRYIQIALVTLTLQTRDAAGNTTTSAAVTVTVNNAGDMTSSVTSRTSGRKS